MRWRIGDVVITRLVELEGPVPNFLPDASPEAVKAIDWLFPDHADERGWLKVSINALIVDTGRRRILVDTCIGNHKPRASPMMNGRAGPFLAELVALGYGRETIDTVLCTHMHLDHVGWNTMLAGGVWAPTFPNARYLFAEPEYRHWRSQTQDAEHRAVFLDSVAPVIDAGLADFVAPDHVVCDEVRLVPTPGHTPGHVSVAIRSKGQAALITGDVLHHPCQMARPAWRHPADVNPSAAERTRRALLERLAREQTLVIGTHFAGPAAGRVRREGRAFRLDSSGRGQA